MNLWLFTLAALAGIAGGWLFYLAAPQQLWRVSPRRPGPALLWSGAAAVLVSLLLLLATMGAMAAVATWLTLLMLVGTLAPFLGAWRAHRRRSRA
ncbi:hypothetical protein DFR40_1143 [Azonexus fungiphilus]|jgi:hypothetical protein|uniref:Uncharacterized protein n=1 Tax=Azonexus fungiphilus TaxID=146940 RepID=A0A495WD22_9RHOO|nr:hypothetical protein [Azonexus fungiphilus]NHC05877.1 hypothetical protein [Azonexus fungiphilus]RKT59259.1 hypothetical protein DFR40_1143 [Azonexus fungiphilus]